METKTSDHKKKHPLKKIILLVVVLGIILSCNFLYNNVNCLLSEALLNKFNASIFSDVYELKFEKLHINLFQGNIRISNVLFEAREKPLNDYPYINSKLRLKTETISLEEVDFFKLLQSGELNVENISILKPELEFTLSGEKPVLFPFKDSLTNNNLSKGQKKKSFDSFRLHQFRLLDASIHITNKFKQREFKIHDFSISLNDLYLNQQAKKDLISFQYLELSVGHFSSSMTKSGLKQLHFRNLKLSFDSLALQKTPDTLTYRFNDFNAGLIGLDLQTADSLFHITLESFELSYKKKALALKNFVFKPNVSHAVLQKKSKYQQVNFSGSAGLLEMKNFHFNELIYQQKIFIDTVLLDKVSVSVYKDKTKPLDTKRFPSYFGQQIMAVSFPLLIKHIKATQVDLTNLERKPDSTHAEVHLNRAKVEVKNITNLNSGEDLVMTASAFLNNKVHFNIQLKFSYTKTQFGFNGSFEKFDLTALNPLIQAYTPAKVHQGIVDHISFTGLAEQAKASGEMRFLYHDLNIDLALKNQAKWKNSTISFAANAVLPTANPLYANQAVRVGVFHVQRDLNKGFINIILKSVLTGLKETMIASKENKNLFGKALKDLKHLGKKK